jgi:hypothetical protein
MHMNSCRESCDIYKKFKKRKTLQCCSPVVTVQVTLWWKATSVKLATTSRHENQQEQCSKRGFRATYLRLGSVLFRFFTPSTAPPTSTDSGRSETFSTSMQSLSHPPPAFVEDATLDEDAPDEGPPFPELLAPSETKASLLVGVACLLARTF